MTSIEKELTKILTNQCPIKKITQMLEDKDKQELNQDIMLMSIEILRMHESEIRQLRQTLELNYQTEILETYFKKKNLTN